MNLVSSRVSMNPKLSLRIFIPFPSWMEVVEASLIALGLWCRNWSVCWLRVSYIGRSTRVISNTRTASKMYLVRNYVVPPHTPMTQKLSGDECILYSMCVLRHRQTTYSTCILLGSRLKNHSLSAFYLSLHQRLQTLNLILT